MNQDSKEGLSAISKTESQLNQTAVSCQRVERFSYLWLFKMENADNVTVWWVTLDV